MNTAIVTCRRKPVILESVGASIIFPSLRFLRRIANAITIMHRGRTIPVPAGSFWTLPKALTATIATLLLLFSLLALQSQIVHATIDPNTLLFANFNDYPVASISVFSSVGTERLALGQSRKRELFECCQSAEGVRTCCGLVMRVSRPHVPACPRLFSGIHSS